MFSPPFNSWVFKIKCTKVKQETGVRVEAEVNSNLIRLRQLTSLSVINMWDYFASWLGMNRNLYYILKEETCPVKTFVDSEQ